MRFSCLYFILVFCFICNLEGHPWGKDSDLCSNTKKCSASDVPPGFSISATLIHFHQDVISPADGPRSHFIPSSSQYTLEAMQTYGFCEGFLLGCDRLMRENSDEWVYRHTLDPLGHSIKYDPVP